MKVTAILWNILYEAGLKFLEGVLYSSQKPNLREYQNQNCATLLPLHFKDLC